jgi:tetratricopeptide (TPR) repeat protein
MSASNAQNDTGRPPYIGLRAFRTEDNDRFFGRSQESNEVATLWRANKLTILYGASGVGKTSLLQAGVIPLLDPERFDILPIGRVPAGLPLSDNPRARNPYVFAFLSSLAPSRPSTELAGQSIPKFLRQRGIKRDRYGDPVPILLAIDQAEEFFSELSYRPEIARKFINGLAQALRENRETRLLLSIREDRLSTVLGYERVLGGRSHVRSRLLPFGASAAMEAIRKPLKGTGRSFQPGVVSELVRDLRTVKATNAFGETSSFLIDSVDPVQVQVVCSALWESLPSTARIITLAHVRRYGNIDRFLASFCSRTLSAVAAEHEVAVARLRSWLLQTFITEHGTRGTAYEGLGQTAGMPNAIVRSLEDRHVIMAEHRGGARWYELQHDRLIEPLQQAHPVELIEAAELELADGALVLAERHAEQAIRTSGVEDLMVRARAQRVLGHVARQRHDADQALDRYRAAASLFEVLEDSSSVAQLLADAGRLSITSGRHGEAVTDLRGAAERAPSDLSVQCALANALWYIGQPLTAVSILSGVIEIDETVLPAIRQRGEILADLNRADEALRDLDRVRRAQSPSTIAARALAHAITGKFEAADQEAADAAANAPDHGPVLFRVARVRQLTGEHTAATASLVAALSAVGTRLPPHLREQASRMLDATSTPATPG